MLCTAIESPPSPTPKSGSKCNLFQLIFGLKIQNAVAYIMYMHRLCTIKICQVAAYVFSVVVLNPCLIQSFKDVVGTLHDGRRKEKLPVARCSPTQSQVFRGSKYGCKQTWIYSECTFLFLLRVNNVSSTADFCSLSRRQPNPYYSPSS